MREVMRDTKKLMNIAGQHGGHLRELFSIASTTASKAELLAAVASIKNSFQHFKNKSLKSNYNPEADFEAEKALNATHNKRHEEMLRIVGENAKRLKELHNTHTVSSSRIENLEQIVAKLNGDNTQKSLHNASLENTVREQQRRILLLESEIGEGRRRYENMQKLLENIISSPDTVVMKSASPYSITKTQPVIASDSVANSSKETMAPIAVVQPSSPSLVVPNDTAKQSPMSDMLFPDTPREKCVTNASLVSCSPTTKGMTSDVNVDMSNESNSTTSLMQHEVSTTDIKENSINNDISDDESVADDAISRALSELLGSAQNVQNAKAHDEEAAAKAAAELACHTSVPIDVTEEILERVTVRATKAAELHIESLRRQIHELDARIAHDNNNRMDAINSGFKKLSNEQTNLENRITTYQNRVEVVNDAMLQLDSEHSALLLAQKDQSRHHKEDNAAYFSAIDHLIGVVDVLHAAVQRQEGISVEVTKKVSRSLANHTQLRPEIHTESPKLELNTNENSLRNSFNTNTKINISARNNKINGANRGVSLSTDQPNSVSLLAAMQSQSSVGGGTPMFSMNDTAGYDALLAPDPEIDAVLDGFMAKPPPNPKKGKSGAPKRVPVPGSR